MAASGSSFCGQGILENRSKAPWSSQTSDHLGWKYRIWCYREVIGEKFEERRILQAVHRTLNPSMHRICFSRLLASQPRVTATTKASL
ncbi:hypothetical protein CY34DRAFT_727469 [Suillus luteus UH-Slu-Lm8-n1]|uniref:Uncharacterized protein n=1 Tax=Suillus luteus UH-Slu-Lm8-n1 TaxID=930992 RepID=A0A0D0AZE0_9AGAM|nr:hypothetical protein CY34DRAFT_727469 [Suillus luteus UH-Slu-Lm8-n1]